MCVRKNRAVTTVLFFWLVYARAEQRKLRLLLVPVRWSGIGIGLVLEFSACGADMDDADD